MKSTSSIQSNMLRASLAASISAMLLVSGCGGGGGGSGNIRPTDFTSWSAVQANSTVRARGISQTMTGTYTGVGDGIQIDSLNAPSAVDEADSYADLTFDASRNLRALSIRTPGSTESWGGSLGSTVGCSDGGCFAENANGFAATLDPYAVGLNYQTFGVWARSGAASGPFTVGVISIGNPTPAGALPTTGTATYNGAAMGFYVPAGGELHMMAAGMSATANFDTRSIAFSTNGTELISSISGLETAAPGLNLSGTLTYAAGTNRFDGAITTANAQLSGNASGRFYGPTAQEIGGVYHLQGGGLESMMGSFGGIR